MLEFLSVIYIPIYAGNMIKPHGFSEAINPATNANPNGNRASEFEKKVDAFPEIFIALFTIKLVSVLLPIIMPKYTEEHVIKIEKRIIIEKLDILYFDFIIIILQIFPNIGEIISVYLLLIIE